MHLEISQEPLYTETVPVDCPLICICDWSAPKSAPAEVDDYDTQGAIMLLAQVELRDGPVQPELNEVGIIMHDD